MAPFGTVLKNSILFLILTAGITYISAQLLVFGMFKLLSSFDIAFVDQTAYKKAISNIWLGLLTLIGGTGVIYMKSLSDTVEEGMIEF